MRPSRRAGGFSVAFVTLFSLTMAQAAPAPSTQLKSPDWQRVTAHVNGVFSPRGFFNLLVGMYSLPSLKSAQFNLGRATIVMDFPPDSPDISASQIHQIERSAGYRPGAVDIERIPKESFSESGPGWLRIKHPQSRNVMRRWLEQNF